MVDATRNPQPGAAPGVEGQASGKPDADLLESLRQIGATGKAGLGASSEAFKAFRSLFAADVSLARSAFGRTLALMGVAIVFGASCWLLLMAALIVFLSRQIGLPWAVALLICALLSGAIAGWAAWLGDRYFEHTRLQATRRQLARLGLGELAKHVPDPGSPQSTRDAGKDMPTGHGSGGPVKDDQGVAVTPP